MSAVNEWIVREYFESLGFLTSQPHKYVAVGRHREADEEFDLLVVNPRAETLVIPEHQVWTGRDLPGIKRAIVAVRGWHSGRFSVATFENSPELLRIVEPDVLEAAGQRLGPGPVAKILCLPKLPASGELKKDTIAVLKAKGIDGVLPFQTILQELIKSVDANQHYEKSDLLQLLRMLKSYDLIRDSQLELFSKRPRG
ncbi:MAG: hypothetical protein O2901_10285 [Verrucomicrobia bacterium]|nr:hypothetical protein [Verrucomicrobiota bacterium]